MQAGRISRRLALCAMLAGSVFCTGCSGLINIFALPTILFGNNIEPKVKLIKSTKVQPKILVLSYANTDLKWGNDSVDDEMTQMMTQEIANAESRFKIVPNRKVQEWRDRHPRWEEKSVQAIGEEFEADYVLFIEVADFAVTDPKSALLYQGRAKINVRVHEIRRDIDIHTETITRDFPADHPVPVSDVPSGDAFRQSFLRTLAREVSWVIVPHASDAEAMRDKW